MIRSTFVKIALAAVAAISIGVADARADLMTQISTNGGVTFTQFGPSMTGIVMGNVSPAPGVNVSVTGTSNTPGAPTFSQVSQTNISVNNPTNMAVSLNLVISVSSINFSAPSGQIMLSSTLSGTYGPGVTGSGTFQSFIDLTNNFFAVAGLTGGPQPFSMTLLGGGTAQIIGAGTLNSSEDISSTPYSLTNTFTFTLNLAPGAQFQVTGTTSVTPVPEPATIVGAGIALASIGAFRFRKRRQPKA
jgi:hypothetical protein